MSQAPSPILLNFFPGCFQFFCVFFFIHDTSYSSSHAFLVIVSHTSHSLFPPFLFFHFFYRNCQHSIATYNEVYKFNLLAYIGCTAAQRRLLAGQPVHLFVAVSEGAGLAGIAPLNDVGTFVETFVCRRLHRHYLPCSKEYDQVDIGAPKTHEQCNILPFPYRTLLSGGSAETLASSYTSALHAWESRAKNALSPFASSKPTSSIWPHPSVAADVEDSAEDVVEAAIYDDITDKAVVGRSSNLQRRRNVNHHLQDQRSAESASRRF